MCFGSRLKGDPFEDISSSQPIRQVSIYNDTEPSVSKSMSRSQRDDDDLTTSDPTKKSFFNSLRENDMDISTKEPNDIPHETAGNPNPNPTNPGLDPPSETPPLSPAPFSADYSSSLPPTTPTHNSTSKSRPTSPSNSSPPPPKLGPEDVSDPGMKERLAGKKSAGTGRYKWRGMGWGGGGGGVVGPAAC